MNDINKIIEKAKSCGFDEAVYLNVSTIKLMDQVRDMCKENKCNKYNTNWSCPPGCSTLEEGRKKLENYSKGVIIQTIGEVEDSFDFETMMEIEEKHKENFNNFYEIVKEEYANSMAFSSGCCTICTNCTYPDKPCRFPQKCICSMEAYGMLVSDICKSNKIKYYYGPSKIAYTSCLLIK